MRRERHARGVVSTQLPATGGEQDPMETRQLDVRGTKCPVPIVRAKKEIDGMRAGEILEVLATDPGSVQDFQGWAKTSKLAILREQRTEKDQGGREVYVHVLERRG